MYLQNIILQTRRVYIDAVASGQETFDRMRLNDCTPADDYDRQKHKM